MLKVNEFISLYLKKYINKISLNAYYFIHNFL